MAVIYSFLFVQNDQRMFCFGERQRKVCFHLVQQKEPFRRFIEEERGDKVGLAKEKKKE